MIAEPAPLRLSACIAGNLLSLIHGPVSPEASAKVQMIGAADYKCSQSKCCECCAETEQRESSLRRGLIAGLHR